MVGPQFTGDSIMSNYVNGTWGRKWSPESEAGAFYTKDGEAIAEGLKNNNITIEEAARALTTQAGELGGFWDDVADQACREGKRMTDIDPRLFPSSRGPRDL
jgi:hypothetical protein